MLPVHPRFRAARVHAPSTGCRAGRAREGGGAHGDRVAGLAREGQRHRSSRRRPRADPGAAHDARRSPTTSASTTRSSTGTRASATTPRWPTLGFLDKARVVDGFRRSLDIAGHVSWVPGGTRAQLRTPRRDDAGRHRARARTQGATRARRASSSATPATPGWISGQALNGFNAAAVPRRADHVRDAPQRHPAVGHDAAHHGPGSAADHRELRHQDPRDPVAARPRARCSPPIGEAFDSAQAGHATLIYPTGFGARRTAAGHDRATSASMYDIVEETRDVRGGAQGAARHEDLDSRIAHELPRRDARCSSACSTSTICRAARRITTAA